MEEMDKKNEIMLVNGESLAKKIYIIRGQKVMLDFELAEIYGYETKRFNEQVKNNIEKFDDDFRFQLTKEEWEFLRSNFSTSKLEALSCYLKKIFILWITTSELRLCYIFTCKIKNLNLYYLCR